MDNLAPLCDFCFANLLDTSIFGEVPTGEKMITSKMDWLDYRVLYVLDNFFGPNLKHTFWQDLNPINFFAIPLWIIREIMSDIIMTNMRF